MANPQKENGYTAIANEIMEKLSLAGITGSEYRVLFVVIRKTYGFHKHKDRISLSQFELFTGMNRAHAVRTINSLVHKRILVKENGVYRFNKNWEEWVVSKRVPSTQTDTTSSTQMDTKSSTQTDTHKRKKDNITKEIANVPFASKEIVEVIGFFKPINPSYGKWYGNTTQRNAILRMLKIHGIEKIRRATVVVQKTNTMPYAPTITTPVQLEDKWAALESFYRKKTQEFTKNKITKV